jgi:GNAT superfamily N-acetyltransferase
MWTQLRQHGGRRSVRPLGNPLLEEVARRYVETINDSGQRLVVAVSDATVVGMALLSVTSASMLLDVPTVQVSHLYVGDGHRRRGIGKALVAAAAAYAGERGVDQVTVSVEPGARDANRFYARLGFAPSVVRRVAPLAVLRRQLAVDDVRNVTLRRELRLRRGALARSTRVTDAAHARPRSEP